MTSAPLSGVVQKRRINILRLVFVALLPLVLFTRSAWEDMPAIHETAEALGALLVISGVLGRFWAILYSGGRKNETVVQDGPYSICRHPLYLFSTMAVLGFGVLIGSVVVTIVFTGMTFLILSMTAAAEERFLIDTFGDRYREYARRVPSILPDLSLYQSPEEVSFHVPHLRPTFRDALVFLAFLPLAELIGFLHETGILPSVMLW